MKIKLETQSPLYSDLVNNKQLFDDSFTEEEVYNDFTDEEMEEWITKLNQKQFAKITDFLANMPKLSQKVEWTCSKCGEKDTVVLEGLQAFFT